MVKDNKFAAEPSADSTADAKKDRNETKVTTTDNVVRDQENPKTEKHLKQASGSKEDEWYQAYVKGDSVQSIADEAKVDTSEVLEAIRKAEANRAKDSKTK